MTDSSEDIRVLYMNDYREDPGDFSAFLENELNQAEGLEIFITGKNTSPLEKAEHDEFYHFNVQELDEMEYDEEDIYEADMAVQLLHYLRKYDENIDSIDTGTILEEEKLSGYNPFTILPASVESEGESEFNEEPDTDIPDPEEVEGFTIAEAVGKIKHMDTEMADYIKRNMEESKDTLIISEAASQIAYQLDAELDVEAVNDKILPEPLQKAVSLAQIPR
ncbi:MAG: hypothetical protein V5A72_02820 [Candidatus Nanohaloarchaea archaeon]